ncbi:MAG: Shedu anti-phage system protein SduA domain-containing protein [Maricaulaceae bacterium]
MSEKNIQTRTVSRGIATTTPIRLTLTKNLKVGFVPTLHDGGIRGKLVKYKKTSSKNWSDVNDSDFTSHQLSGMEKITIDLDTEATTLLLAKLTNLKEIVKQGIEDGQTEYVVAQKGKTLIINDENKLASFKEILDGGHSDEFWKLIETDQPDLANRLVAGHIQQVRAKIITELKRRLTEKHSETTGPDSWQKWIFKHNWLFGVNYQEPIEKQKVNITGVMPDYLFPRIDGFVDLLEIKLPNEEVIVPDSSHAGSYRWNAETAKAIGQVVSYLSEIERLQLEIEKLALENQNRKVSMLKPRAYILIGNSEGWPQAKLNGLRKLNNYLHGIEVLTYQELIDRGEAFLKGTTFELSTKPEEDEIEIPF